jgi:hypothetical protein
MHDTKVHINRANSRDSRANSRDMKGRNTYHIMDHKYRDGDDSIYKIELQQKGARDNEEQNIFRSSKNN